MAAQTKLTPLLRKAVLDYMDEGYDLIGRKKGHGGQEPFASFLEDAEKKEAEPRAAAMKSWRKEAKYDWRAAKALVEYTDKQKRTSPENAAAEIEEILEIVQLELGADAHEKVLRVIVDRGRSEATEGPGAALRLVGAK